MAAGTLAPSDDAIQGVQAPAMPAIQGGAAPTPTAPPQAAPQQPGLAPAPAGGIQQGTGNNKGEIQTSPEVQPEYDPKKLAKAQTTLDLLNAMKPKSRTDYMDWWEKQHGDIDDKYDNLKTQLGARPSDDEPQTKKEKFAALLEFGLHLMKASSPASTNQGAVLTSTLSDEHDAMDKAHADSIASAQKTYDTSADAIESQRAEEQKGIGTPAQAMAAQAKQNLDDSTETKNTAQAYKAINDTQTTKASSLGAPTYAVGPGGVIHAIVRDADGHAHAEPVTGIDGKPFAGKILGREAGSGIDKDQSTSAIRNQKYLTDVLGVDPNTAMQVAFKQKTGNPNQDHASVYRAVLQTTMGDDEKAKRVADQYILDNYGAGAITRANAPAISPQGADAPPASALNGLQPGMKRDFGAKGVWTIGIDGKPKLVSGGPQTIQ
jgi:hypothetical protein